MKYIINLITKNISLNMKKNNDESLILINGFEDLQIYLSVAEKLTDIANHMGKSINIKLAKKKWQYFKQKYAGSHLLLSMEQRGWVSEEESTTFYRNQHIEDVLVLLGTETEDDISGSLKDIYQIRCDRLVDFLPKNKGKICYSDIINFLGVNFDDRENMVIDKLYRDLFEFVAPDICKLSNILEKSISSITTINDFGKFFFENLPIWGLPKKVEEIPNLFNLKRGNILRNQYNFINGHLFRSFTPAMYKKYKRIIDKYEEEQKTYCSLWNGWSSQNIKSYEEFSDVLLSFIKGDSSAVIRNQLLNLDYSIIEDVLNLKIKNTDTDKPKKSVETLRGNPLHVFLTVHLEAMNYLLLNGYSSDQIILDFNDVTIVTEASEDDNGLIDAWKNICIHTNGIIGQITDYGFELNENKVSLICEPQNFFDINASLNNLIHAAGPNIQMNKILFSSYCVVNNKPKKIKEYKWVFENNENWLNSFRDLTKADFVNTPNNPFIPLTVSKKLKSLISKRSEEEFFDYLTEKCDMDFSFNILDNGACINQFKQNGKYVWFYDLGKKFSSFCYELVNKGLYNVLSTKSNTSFDLIEEYKKLGKIITSTKFNENEYYILDLFIHAFNIEESNKSLAHEKDIECCIVPPWHPASVEKIKHMVLFVLDGCYQLWQDIINNYDNSKKILNLWKEKLEELFRLSTFQNAVDVFPTDGSAYFGNTTSYGQYSLYAKNDLEEKNNLRDLIKKESVFDDEFKDKSYTTITEDSKMIYGVIEKYIKAFPDSKDNLNLVFIDPSDLQPIVSAVHHYISVFQKNYEDRELYVTLRILVKPKNKGGKNYITYWMNENFDLDSKIKIKTYINEWNNKNELDKMLNSNNDIVFVMDLLKVNDYEFINKIDSYQVGLDECYYPVVFRPSPNSQTTLKRRIELTQPQFVSAAMHTQVVHYRKNLENDNVDFYYAVKSVNVDEEIQKIVDDLHKKAYWVVCIDASMDGKILKDHNSDDEYSVIGFSTGKGNFGQYNITITARKSILKSIENNFSRRLSQMFHWNSEHVAKAAKICMNEASGLDGISVLTASNQRDYNVNEFMAYVLTSLREKEIDDNSPLKIIVHLDSYKHWFDGKDDSKFMFEENPNKSRPDFLVLSINSDFQDKLTIDAKVVECKMASYYNSSAHVLKATQQVKHGVEVLSKIFDPNSSNLKRRYWYAQLYRALAFAQISFNNNSDEFHDLANKLRGLLNGNFEINWTGEILGYWLDMDGESEVINDTEGIALYNIPQKRIQKLILGKDASISFIQFDTSLLADENSYEKIAKEQESKIDEILETQEKIRLSNLEESIVKLTNKKFDDLNSLSFLEVVEENISSNLKVENKSMKEITIDEKPKENLSVKNDINIPLNSNSVNKENSNEIDSNTGLAPIKANISKDVRVLVGQDKFGQNLYWEFGHKQLANRHLLITGTSGQGKTYCIQTMLYELLKYNISSVIFDYTEGFTSNQLEKEFLNRIGDRINEHIVYHFGVPINPFKRHEIEISGKTIKEKVTDVATRLANIFKHVYKFGDQQFAAIFSAVHSGMNKYGDQMNMIYFKTELEGLTSSNPAAKSVLNKMTPFFYSIEFENDSDFNWSEVLYSNDAKINIFQLTSIDREMQVIITELMLWDAWYYTQKVGTKDKPFAVILDEAQNLSHKQSSPSAKILTEGRKFGWSAWFATQSLKVLADDEIVRLMQASFKLYFKPTDDELVKISKQVDPTDSSAWLTPIKSLSKGQCLVIGDRLKNDGTFGSCKPTVTSVLSFEKRD